MALNPSSVTFNSAYPLTGGKWQVDFTSPMINGFPFQYIQDFNVQWANFTAADTGLESVTVGGVTKLAGDSSTWSINSSTVTGYATFATSAPDISNSNVVFKHTEYGEEDFGGGGGGPGGGGGGGPQPITTTDFVNLSVSIVSSSAPDIVSVTNLNLELVVQAPGVITFAEDPIVLDSSSIVYGTSWRTDYIIGTSSTGEMIDKITPIIDASFFTDLVTDRINIGGTWFRDWMYPGNEIGEVDVTGNLSTRVYARQSGPPYGTTDTSLQLTGVDVNGAALTGEINFRVIRGQPEIVTIANLGLELAFLELVTVLDLNLQAITIDAVEVVDLQLALMLVDLVSPPVLNLEAVVNNGVMVSPLMLSLDIRDPEPDIVQVKPLHLRSKISTIESITVSDLKLVMFVNAGSFAFAASSTWCGESV